MQAVLQTWRLGSDMPSHQRWPHWGFFSPLFLCMAVPVAGGGVQELLRGFLGQQESTIMVSSTALASSIMHRAHVNA
jgi:hypothetical protein